MLCEADFKSPYEAPAMPAIAGTKKERAASFSPMELARVARTMALDRALHVGGGIKKPACEPACITSEEEG